MHLDVIGVFRAERAGSHDRVAKQQTAGVNGNEEPLVRIERNGISALEPGEQVRLAFVQNTRSTVRAIDVKPEVKLASNLANLNQRINRSRIRRSRTRHHTKRSQSTLLIRFNLLYQFVDAHALPLVTADNTHLIAPKPEYVRRLRNRQDIG